MENKRTALVAVLCAFASVNVVTSFDSYNCLRSKTAMKNFELDKWSGHWYFVSASGLEGRGRQKCIQNFHTRLSEKEFNIRAAMSLTPFFGDPLIKYGKAVAKSASNTNEGKFNVTFLPQGSTSTSSGDENPLYILGTDYENYAVTYGCSSTPNIDYHFISILSRTPQLDEEFQSKANEIIFAQNLDPSTAETVVQDCGNLLY